MSAEIIDTTEGIITIRVSGKLTHPDLVAVQQRAAELLKQQHKMRILVLAEEFEGWEQQGDWGDLGFQVENDQFIERMALVGKKKWTDLAMLFTAKGFRKFPIEFFPPEAAAQARAWLTK